MVGNPEPSTFPAPNRARTRRRRLRCVLLLAVAVAAFSGGAVGADPPQGPVGLKAEAKDCPARNASCGDRDCVVALPAVTPWSVMIMMLLMMGASTAMLYWGLLQPRAAGAPPTRVEPARRKSRSSKARWSSQHALQRAMRRRAAPHAGNRRRVERGHLTASRARKRRDGPGCRD